MSPTNDICICYIVSVPGYSPQWGSTGFRDQQSIPVLFSNYISRFTRMYISHSRHQAAWSDYSPTYLRTTTVSPNKHIFTCQISIQLSSHKLFPPPPPMHLLPPRTQNARNSSCPHHDIVTKQHLAWSTTLNTTFSTLVVWLFAKWILPVSSAIVAFGSWGIMFWIL